MPNGGSDCCGTCWFNRANRGRAGYSHSGDVFGDSYCEIRDVEIQNPFWTYCANHPHRRPDKDPIPIGPVKRNSGTGSSDDREDWIPSPDTPEIRQHLLDLLETFFEHVSKDRYPIGPSIGEAIIHQLGVFREPRAEKHIQWINDNLSEYYGEIPEVALARIRGEHSRKHFE